MPQPPIDIQKYLATPLPALREQYPPGTGGTGPRAEWPEGTLKGVQVIDNFAALVGQYTKDFPETQVSPHPNYKYPKFVQVISSLPNPIRSPADLQKCLSTLPLGAIASVLTALDADPADLAPASKKIDSAGYESDGGEEDTVAPRLDSGKTKAWFWKFNKSPMGSGEFLLMRQGSDEVYLVVRTINSSAFTQHDWDEYAVTGPYHYSTKSKASWYWSRTWGASRRLGARYWVLTDWQRWTFGCFDKDRTHGWVSDILPHDSHDPTILQALFFWAKLATGAATNFNIEAKDVSHLPALFPANPARRVSISGSARAKVTRDDKKIKTANESDIEESDVE